MEKKPKLLDLFCGAGGCAVGYHRVGFDVVGVDINPQKNYPFPFIQMDVFEAMRRLLNGEGLLASDGIVYYLRDFNAIHASPPCQKHSSLKYFANDPINLIPETRAELNASGLPYVIENVVGAPLNSPIMLCGTMFKGLGVKRHRLFESNINLAVSLQCDHSYESNPPRYKTLRHGKWYQSRFCPVYGGGGGKGASGVKDWGPAMGINWIPTRKELSQAIPPVYTEYVGKQLIPLIKT